MGKRRWKASPFVLASRSDIAICTGIEVRHRVDRSHLAEGGLRERVGGRVLGGMLRKEMERRESHTLIIQQNRQAYHLHDCGLLS